MDFDLIEKLNDEDVKQLYDDVIEDFDNKISMCKCQTWGDIEIEKYGKIVYSTLTSGWHYFTGDCGDPANYSHSACQAKCDEAGDGSAHIGAYGTSVYCGFGENFCHGHMLNVNITGTYIQGEACYIPENAVCPEEGTWSRNGKLQTNNSYFINHCT